MNTRLALPLRLAAVAMFCVLPGSPAWAQQAAPPSELEAVKRMVQEVISQNEDLKKRVRELEAAIAKPESGTKGAATEPTTGPAKEAAKESTEEPAKELALEAPKAPVKEAAAEPLTAAKGPWGRIQLGGAVEVEVTKKRSYSGVNTSELTLSTAEFDFEADILDWAKAELSLEWDSTSDTVKLNEALLTLEKPSVVPLYLKTGRGVVPFGISTGTTVAAKLEETLTLTGPLTTDVVEAKEDYVLLGVKSYGFDVSAYLYNGSTNDLGGGAKRLQHYGFAAGYERKFDNVSFSVGVGLIDSLYDSDGLTEAVPEMQTQPYVPGVSAYLKLGLWGFSFIGEYDTAVRNARFSRTTTTEDENGDIATASALFNIRPQTWQVEAAYTTDIFFGWRTYVAFNYSETSGMLGTFPRRRMLSTAGTWFADNVRLALEYGNDKDYSKAQQGTGRDSDYWTLRLTYEW